MQKVVFNNFLTPVWQERVKYIVIDEAHCIDKWGDSFRKEFGNLGRLRSLFPLAKTLALTGTATRVTVMNIKKSLNLNNPKIVKTSVIRNNIKIEVERKPQDSRGSEAVYEKVMSRTFNDFENENINYPKTIIYSQLKFCGLGYSLVERNGAHELADGTRIAAQYHSPCTDKMKEDVQLGMREDRIRLLFATEAYSMGTDSPDIRRIIHFGVPYTLETYLQEIGRAGRDGELASAVIYFNKNDIARNTPCEESMRGFINTNECRWEFISKHFDEGDEHEITHDHNCCDNCALTCACSFCLSIKKEEPNLESASAVSRISKQNRQTLEHLLLSYFNAENVALSVPNPELISGLDAFLLDFICCNAFNLQTSESLKEKFPCLNSAFVENILIIINHVLNDNRGSN